MILYYQQMNSRKEVNKIATPAQNRATAKWQKKATVCISLRLLKTTDADILQALDGKAKQTEIKRLIRLALAAEKEKEK